MGWVNLPVRRCYNNNINEDAPDKSGALRSSVVPNNKRLVLIQVIILLSFFDLTICEER